MAPERYSESRARKEADRLVDKIAAGEAPDYETAEAQVEAERAERLKDLEFIVDTRLEKVLRDQFKKINEGNAGVILKISFDDVPSDVIDWLEEQGIELRENQVAKVLKIYNRGSAKEEFDIQKKAYDVLKPYEDDQTVAKVPRPHFWRELKLSESTQDFMRKAGAKASDRIEVIMMDYVPGEDVAAKLMKELMVMGRYMVDDSGKVLIQEAQDASYPDLEKLGALSWVANYLDWKDYELSPGDRLTPEEIQLRKEKANDFNEEKIYRVLHDRGFQLHPLVVTQIEKAMRILHENGIVFRDGHQRNFMVNGDWSGGADSPPRVTIIDFGGSATFEGDYASQEEELYRSNLGDKGYINDFNVVRKLKKLTTDPETRGVRTPASDFAERLESKRAQMAAAKPSRFLNELKAIVADAGGKPAPDAVYERMPGKDDLKVENALAGLKTLIEQGSISEDAVRAYLEAKKLELPAPLADKVGWFLESL